MKVSVNWIRELVPGLEGTPRELADRLSMRAVPVDEVVPVGEGLSGIRVARVEEVRRHPNADRLWLCRVDPGEGEPVAVVCGAPTVEEGALYPWAPPGATLPGGMRIEAREIRGESSRGMLCSEAELGLGRDESGILRLPESLDVGAPLDEALGLPDHLLVLDLTPNRVDLACHVGVARELAPEGEAGIVLPRTEGPGWEPGWTDGEKEATGAEVEVRIEAADRCRRYLGAVVRGIRIGPSPPWLAGRLRAAGVRPVNNVVDATNYVLLERNQPLHAFDLARLEGPEIAVRAGEPGETLRTLDGVERKLGPEETVIADAAGPVALAGVMGGEESEVTGDTRDIFLECAAFTPSYVRRTARSTGLATEASYRFERGIDERASEEALARCVELVLATAGGEADSEGVRVGGPPRARTRVRLRAARIRQVLGIDPDPYRVRRLLAPLGFEVADGDGTDEGAYGGRSGGAPAARAGGRAGEPPADWELEVDVPGWRGDVTREVDLVEEVARRHGYEAFPDEERRFRPSRVSDDPAWDRMDRVRGLFVARGLLEARSSGFVPEAQPGGRAEVRLSNPLSAEESHLRRGLVPVLLRRVEHNFARDRRDVRLFEIGTVFHLAPQGEGSGDRPAGEGETDRSRGPFPAATRTGNGDAPAGPRRAAELSPGLFRFQEEVRAAAVLTGRREPPHWSGDGEDLDLWDLKGLAADVAERLCGGEVEPLGEGDSPPPPASEWLAPGGYGLVRGDELVGVAGPVRPEALDAPPWAGSTWGIELRLEAVRPAMRRAFRPLSAYPAVRRDLAVTIPEGVPAARVEGRIRAEAPETLESVELFDVYEGEGIETSRRSLAWTFRFRAPDRTLTDREVEEAMERIVSALEDGFDARVRDS